MMNNFNPFMQGRGARNSGQRQPAPNFGPQPGPGAMIQQPQNPFMGDRIGPGQDFAQRFGGQQFGPGFNFAMPQFGGQQFGPQQPNPQMGPQRPSQQFGPQQHWTPPSVNMPLSQQHQPWMGGQQQMYNQYIAPHQQTNPFQSRRPQQNPFMRGNKVTDPGNFQNADRGMPVNQPPPQNPGYPPSYGGGGSYYGPGGGPMPGSGFNPFAQLSQQSHQQIMPTFRR